MAFKTFTPGVLTSSDLNTFLMRQAVITCTSSTRPASPNEGMTIYETDTDTLLIYDSSIWRNAAQIGAFTTWTPTFTNWSIGNANVTLSRFGRVGRMVLFTTKIVFGSTTTTSATALIVNLPVQLAGTLFASAHLFDVSAGTRYDLEVDFESSTTMVVSYFVAGTKGEYQSLITGQPISYQTGDELYIWGMYEAAA